MRHDITVWKDKKIGTAEISLDRLMNVGFESHETIPIEIKNVSNKLVGAGQLEVFMR